MVRLVLCSAVIIVSYQKACGILVLVGKELLARLLPKVVIFNSYNE